MGTSATGPLSSITNRHPPGARLRPVTNQCQIKFMNQLSFKLRTWGGKRRHAGRKPKGHGNANSSRPPGRAHDRNTTAWASFSLTSLPSSVNSSAPDRVSRQVRLASCQAKCQACKFADSQICWAAEWEFTTNFAPSSNSRVRMSPARSDSTPSRSRRASSSLRRASPAGRPKSLSSIACPPFQRLAGEAECLPLRKHPRSEAAVELEGGCVPVQYLPVHPAAFLAHRDPGQFDEQGPADSSAPQARRHVQILEIHPPASQPGRVGVEIEGGSRRCALPVRHQAEVPW